MIKIITFSQILRIKSNDLEKVLKYLYPTCNTINDFYKLGVVSITVTK